MKYHIREAMLFDIVWLLHLNGWSTFWKKNVEKRKLNRKLENVWYSLTIAPISYETKPFFEE